MKVSNTKQITKTSDNLAQQLAQELAESRDWTQIRRKQKIDIELSNPEYLQLFMSYGRRITDVIESCLLRGIEMFYRTRMSELIVDKYTPQRLEELIGQIAKGAETSRSTIVKQTEVKLTLNEKFNWIYNNFKGILGEIRINPRMIKPIPLSKVNATHVDKLVCFECNIDGVEVQQAITDKYDTEKSGLVMAEKYSKDLCGAVRKIIYEDFQYYWLREPTHEFSEKKSLRKIAAKSYGRFVSRYETGDKVRVLGFYRTIDQKGIDEKGVEIEIINMEKLDDDVEVVLTKQELLNFKNMSSEDPESFIKEFVTSCAPHIQGNDTAKLGIVLSEIGPSKLVEKYRPHIHILLEGNPGTAKSEMLKWFAKISFMGVYADAPNASSRGLMYGQEEHGKRKILKAGLMVRNRKLYLDELDKMGETRQELNTAMEQQIASYHKNPFDIDTEIDCTVIAAANPQFGKWKDGIDLLEQLKPLKPELLSRFLIIRVIKTGKTRERLAHILDTMQERQRVSPKFSERQIAGLLNHCRKLNPKLTEQAETVILDFAELFEGIKQEEDSNLEFEVRAQINVIRVSSALAKFLQKDTIDELCVRLAIKFIKECAQSLGMATEVPSVQTDFGGVPINKDVAFLRIVKSLQKESEDGCFSEFELIKKMLELDQFWKTEEAATGYWNKFNPRLRKESPYYEPHTGRFQKT
ncbi:MAG: hypothetical protein K5785_00795 [Nitrosarchaeum sp.]|nr:hypothetical protein [Nitrosarchaeum sp.]